MLHCGIQVLVAILAAGVCLIPMCQAQVCGRPPLGSRIVGGVEAVDGEWPWQVDIEINGHHSCGGSIISENWVLSAAHCFPNPSAVSSYVLYMGRYQLNNLNQYETSRSVNRVLIPSGYVTPQNGKDMALVQLSSPLSWTDRIQPVCLPHAGLQFDSGIVCSVTGWGNTQEGVAVSGAGTLRKVEVPIIAQDSCNTMYQSQSLSDPVTILADMICAGFQQGGKDACQGDSGGPLVCRNSNGSWVQAGVVSFGNGCARQNSPGVYAKVSSYTDFIQSNVPDVQLVDGAHHSAPHSFLLLLLCLTVLISAGRWI